MHTDILSNSPCTRTHILQPPPNQITDRHQNVTEHREKLIFLLHFYRTLHWRRGNDGRSKLVCQIKRAKGAVLAQKCANLLVHVTQEVHIRSPATVVFVLHKEMLKDELKFVFLLHHHQLKKRKMITNSSHSCTLQVVTKELKTI